MKISKIIYLLGLALSLSATASCTKASMGSKGGSRTTVLERADKEEAKANTATATRPTTDAAVTTNRNENKENQIQSSEVTKSGSGSSLVVVEQKQSTRARELQAVLSYANETEQKETSENRGLISEVWAKSEIMKGVRAVNVSDDKYETTLISTQSNPYVSNGLFHAIIPAPYLAVSQQFYPCDLNTIGACVVFEKDSRSGKTVMKAYVVGSATKAEKSAEIRIARRDITDKSMQTKVADVLKNKADGIYIYSLAPAREETIDLQDSLISAAEAQELIAADVANQKQGDNDQKIEIVTDAEEKARIKNDIETVVAKATVQKANQGSNFAFNKCAVTSVESEKNPTHGLKTVRRIFILDFVNVVGMLKGNAELPLKIGKGLLSCNLWNGDVQRVHILIKEFVSPFTVGLMLSRGKQSLVAGGIGYANGARDILEIKDYGYIVHAEGLQVLAASALGATGWGLVASAFAGNLAVTPIVLSGSVDHKPILAGVVTYSLRWGMPNVRVTIGGRYEITIDPDDT